MDQWSRHGYHVQHMNRWHDEVQIELYTGDAASAWRRVRDGWDAVRRSHLLRVQQVRIFLTHLRGRCALAAAGNDKAVLRSAAADARALRRERMPWADALGRLLDAGVAWGRGDSRAAALFGEAAEWSQEADMHLYAAVARRRQGELLGGAEGKAIREEAEAWMAGQGIRNIERMTALLAPAGGG
jgi:hypothetical protein